MPDTGSEEVVEMKKMIRNLLYVFAMGILLVATSSVVSDAKTVRIAPNVQKGKTKTIYTVKKKQKGKVTLKKVTAKTSNKSVASVKVAKGNSGKKYCVKVTGKKTGSVMITVKVKKKMPSGKMKISTVKYKINIISASSESDSEEDSGWDWTPDRFNSPRIMFPSPSVTSAPERTEEVSTPVPANTPTPPISTSQPDLTQKYKYELKVIDPYAWEENDSQIANLYNNNLFCIYVKTDNPDSSSIILDSDSGVMGGFEFPYKDRYADIRGEGDWYTLEKRGKVDGGYVLFCSITDTIGKVTLTLYEKQYEKSDSKVKYDKVKTNAAVVINLRDYVSERDAWFDSVMEELSMEGMTDYQKMYAMSKYLRHNFKYYTTNAKLTQGLWAEECQPVWLSKHLECGRATTMLHAFARKIGVESKTNMPEAGCRFYHEGVYEDAGLPNPLPESYKEHEDLLKGLWPIAGVSHFNNLVYIDGKEYVFDGCPNSLLRTIIDEDFEIIYLI